MYLDSMFHGTNMGPIWGRQDSGGPHVGPMNFAIWGSVLVFSYELCVTGFVLPNLTPVTLYCTIMANVRLTVLVWENPQFDYEIHNSYMDSNIRILFNINPG